MLVALPLFVLMVLRPDEGAGTLENNPSFLARLARWWWGAWIVGIISGAAWFWLVAAQMSDDSPWAMTADDLSTLLWQTWFGQLWLARGIVGILLGVAMFFAGGGGGGGGGRDAETDFRHGGFCSGSP